jgi:phenylalanyl-tRNA synthetase beta chain
VGYEGKVIEISNPSNEEFTIIRPNLVVDMLDTFAINKMKGLPQKFYEIGYVQTPTGNRKKFVFGVMDRKLAFSDVRGYLQMLAEEAGFEFTLEKKSAPGFNPEISCVVVVGGKELGIFGKVDAKILERFGLGFEAYICELEL